MVRHLTLNTQFAYSPYCSLYIFQDADKENLLNNQELLQKVIISFILMTSICDSEVIWKEKLAASHSLGPKD